jgi:hypothetical protein
MARDAVHHWKGLEAYVAIDFCALQVPALETVTICVGLKARANVPISATRTSTARPTLAEVVSAPLVTQAIPILAPTKRLVWRETASSSVNATMGMSPQTPGIASVHTDIHASTKLKHSHPMIHVTKSLI